MSTLRVCTLLWDPNEKSQSFSRVYDEAWVEKLYWGFRRNLTCLIRFTCFVDRVRILPSYIEQKLIASGSPDYGTCIEPYQLNEPMILVGLDTIVVGNIDHLADYCFTEKKIALPKAVYKPNTVCNGVALVPGGHRRVYDEWRGQNDMEWMRLQDYAVLDDLFPGQIVSYKGRVKSEGLGDARIVFFHGREKPHELNEPWIREHWRAGAVPASSKGRTTDFGSVNRGSNP